MAQLETYRRKRNFGRTPEPDGGVGADARGGKRRFVIHKHAARRLHYDLRLEDEGVLRSWAVPKGPSMRPGEKRLAVQVEDHPLEYGAFEGVIPAGEYGAGTVMLWDQGHWRELRRAAGRLDFVLEGAKLRGNWSLVRMGGKAGEGGKNWLLIKRSDASATADGAGQPDDDRSVVTGRTMEEIERGLSSGESRGRGASLSSLLRNAQGARRSRMPVSPRPQLATLVSEAPQGEGWIHEIKFDGYRVLAWVKAGEVKLITRNGLDWRARFAPIGDELAAITEHEMILDGEVVAFASDGVSRFPLLQESLKTGRTGDLTYQVFDLLYLDGFDLRATPLGERKRILHHLLEKSALSLVRYTDHVAGSGREFHAHSCELGLEGVVCKRVDSLYREKRSADWLKVKCVKHQEMVVGGYTAPKGGRSAFGALLLGAFREGRLIYSGKVGTGFSEAQLQLLGGKLARLEQPQSPFHDPPAATGVRWVRPRLVVDIRYTQWTREGRLRHPVFRGLREDRDPEDISMPESRTGRGAGARRAAASPNRVRVEGVALTHPERVLYPHQGITKLGLAEYYAAVSDWILPQLRHRPLSLLRCPQGRGKQCFFQKHPQQSLAPDVPQVAIEEKAGPATYLYIDQPADLIALVQAGTLELHVWGSRVDDLERPDLLVFDLDPAVDVAWAAVREAALSLRERLRSFGFESFVRTTGGKGLHLVVPLQPSADWATAKAFARAVAAAHAHDDEQHFTVNPSMRQRDGRIFIDYLRNSRGATAIASYSTRARAGAPVAVPLRWSELGPRLRNDRYSVVNLPRRLAALRSDPWQDFEAARRPLTRTLLRRSAPGGD